MWTPGPILSPSSSLNLLDSRKSTVVTWLSPQENDTFGSWDTLTAKWNSQEVLDSPVFRLCAAPDNSLKAPFIPSQNEMGEAYVDTNCGSKISPTAEENGDWFSINL